MKIVLTALVLSFILISCSSKSTHIAVHRCASNYGYADQTEYDVKPDAITPEDIEVDTSGLNINMSKVDRLTNEVEECLIKTFGNPPVLPPDVIRDGKCDGNTFELPIRKQCLVVKVASNWFLSKYEYAGSKHQLLPYTNGGMCTNKGLPAGVCYYRVGIQDDLTIAVPPSFHLYKDGLMRIVTGCRDPWYSLPLAICMEPSTPPLGDGSEP